MGSCCVTPGAQPSARGVRWEEGPCVHLWLMHVDVWQGPIQYFHYPPIKNKYIKKEKITNKITKHYFALYCHHSVEILNIINDKVFSFRGMSCYPWNTH